MFIISTTTTMNTVSMFRFHFTVFLTFLLVLTFAMQYSPHFLLVACHELTMQNSFLQMLRGYRRGQFPNPFPLLLLRSKQQRPRSIRECRLNRQTSHHGKQSTQGYQVTTTLQNRASSYCKNKRFFLGYAWQLQSMPLNKP